MLWIMRSQQWRFERNRTRLAWIHFANPVSAEITRSSQITRQSLFEGGMPDYDEWDALFYHWYQPSQINLAYSIIKSTLTRHRPQ